MDLKNRFGNPPSEQLFFSDFQHCKIESPVGGGGGGNEVQQARTSLQGSFEAEAPPHFWKWPKDGKAVPRLSHVHHVYM